MGRRRHWVSAACHRLRRVPAMALFVGAKVVALRVFLLRVRLLAVRSLLRWVIALRSFIRSHGERIATGAQPTDIHPWVWIPIGQRKGRLLAILLIGAACAATGFMAGRQYEVSSSAPSSTTAVVVSKNSAVKPEHIGEKPDLALKGENADVPTEVSRPKPQTPDVVVLNPGMADQKGNSPTQASAQAKTPPADTDVSRRDVTRKKADDHRLSTSRRPMRGYQDLRDYVLKR